MANNDSLEKRLLLFSSFEVEVIPLVVTDGLGCQVVKRARTKLEVGIKDCSGGVPPSLGGLPKAAHHPLPS